jgi:hypothetical protein
MCLFFVFFMARLFVVLAKICTKLILFFCIIRGVGDISPNLFTLGRFISKDASFRKKNIKWSMGASDCYAYEEKQNRTEVKSSNNERNSGSKTNENDEGQGVESKKYLTLPENKRCTFIIIFSYFRIYLLCL